MIRGDIPSDLATKIPVRYNPHDPEQVELTGNVTVTPWTVMRHRRLSDVVNVTLFAFAVVTALVFATVTRSSVPPAVLREDRKARGAPISTAVTATVDTAFHPRRCREAPPRPGWVVVDGDC